MNNTVCLHVFHILRHTISRPSTKSTQHLTTIALKKNFSPLWPGKYRKSTNNCLQRHHQGNQGMTNMQAEMNPALGALRSVRSKRSLLRRYDSKNTFQAMGRKRIRSRIMWIERPLWKERKLKTQRQQFRKSRMISDLINNFDSHSDSRNNDSWRC